MILLSKRWVALAILFLPYQAASQPDVVTKLPLAPDVLFRVVDPAIRPDFDKDVLKPLRWSQADKAIKDAADEAERVSQAEIASYAIVEANSDIQPMQAPVASDLVAGVLGYSLPYGNCINEPGVNNPGYGNPIDWPSTSYEPWIGATALFTWNHTAIVTGFHANGDIEVRQQNSPGAPHRYPTYLIRGYR